MAIVLRPPLDGSAPFRQFQLTSGTVVRPDFAQGGLVTLEKEADAIEMEKEGWRRMPALTKALAEAVLQKRSSPELSKTLVAFEDIFERLANLENQLRKIEKQGNAVTPRHFVMHIDEPWRRR
jgi:hypothetical protein